MSKKPAFIFAPCENCSNKTRHNILSEHIESHYDEYHCQISFSVIECRGCGRKSFRKVFSDFEGAFPGENNQWEVPETIEYFPKIHDKLNIVEEMFHVPDLVERVYEETLLAIREEAYILASVGLRATIEAICNDQNISGRTLDKRITVLASQGLISTKDSSRLHGIRFLGNDAAHEIKKPKKDQINVALKIINHLIQNVYILDKETDGRLDIVLDQWESFKGALDQKVRNFQKGEEIPLVAMFGKDVRRLTGYLSQLEQKLMEAIKAGDYCSLEIGKKEKYLGSPQELQHFIVR